MKPNLSIYDTIIRIFVACIWGAIFGAFGNILGVLAVYPLVTALSAWDPVYQAKGWSTVTELEDHHHEEPKKMPSKPAKPMRAA